MRNEELSPLLKSMSGSVSIKSRINLLGFNPKLMREVYHTTPKTKMFEVKFRQVDDAYEFYYFKGESDLFCEEWGFEERSKMTNEEFKRAAEEKHAAFKHLKPSDEQMSRMKMPSRRWLIVRMMQG